MSCQFVSLLQTVIGMNDQIFNYPMHYVQCATLVCFYCGSSLARYFVVTNLLITTGMVINGAVIKSERST